MVWWFLWKLIFLMMLKLIRESITTSENSVLLVSLGMILIKVPLKEISVCEIFALK